MHLAQASVAMSLSLPNTHVAWTDFEGFHDFLRPNPSDPPEQAEETFLRLAARLGKARRRWMQYEVLTPRGRRQHWQGISTEGGSSVVKLEPLEGGQTLLRLEVPSKGIGHLPTGARTLRCFSERLQNDLSTFRYLVECEQTRVAQEIRKTSEATPPATRPIARSGPLAPIGRTRR